MPFKIGPRQDGQELFMGYGPVWSGVKWHSVKGGALDDTQSHPDLPRLTLELVALTAVFGAVFQLSCYRKEALSDGSREAAKEAEHRFQLIPLGP